MNLDRPLHKAFRKYASQYTTYAQFAEQAWRQSADGQCSFCGYQNYNGDRFNTVQLSHFTSGQKGERPCIALQHIWHHRAIDEKQQNLVINLERTANHWKATSEQWKAKAHNMQQTIDTLQLKLNQLKQQQNKVSELERTSNELKRSSEQWKDKAQKAQQQLDAVNDELTQLKQTLQPHPPYKDQMTTDTKQSGCCPIL